VRHTETQTSAASFLVFPDSSFLWLSHSTIIYVIEKQPQYTALRKKGELLETESGSTEFYVESTYCHFHHHNHHNHHKYHSIVISIIIIIILFFSVINDAATIDTVALVTE
jgi:hypothetical protein